MVETNINIAEIKGGQGGAGGKEVLTSPLQTINVTETSTGHQIDIEPNLKAKAESAYDSSIGRRIHAGTINKFEMFRIYYENANSGREASFNVLIRHGYEIVAIVNYTIIVGYANNDGQGIKDYVDFNYTTRFVKDGYDVSSMICAVNIAKRATTSSGCVIVYFNATKTDMMCCFTMGARYPEVAITNGTLDYSHLGQTITITSSMTPVMATLFKSNDKVDIDKILEVLDGHIIESTASWQNINLSNSTSLNGWWIDGDGKWYSSSSCSMKFVKIPSGASKIKITSNGTYASFCAIAKSVSPSSRQLVDTAEGVSGRITTLKGESSEWVIGTDAKYVIYSVSSNGTYNQIPESISYYSGTEETIIKIKDEIDALNDRIDQIPTSSASKYKKPVVTFGTTSQSIRMFGNTDGDADDAKVVNHGQLITINGVHYCFYLGLPASGTDENSYHILSAYSTDGTTWQRGFPAGVTPPVSGTNRLINEGGLIEHCIVKVADPSYPYRLICNKFISSSTQTMKMYKSADGINYSFMRDILSEKHDSQIGAISKGNVIKVFSRIWDSAHTNRQIGVMYIDLEGNIITPLHVVLGDNLYTSAVSMLDIDREIMFPTWYIGVNTSTQQDAHLECYVMEGELATKLTTNINDIVKSDEYWALVGMGMISANGKQYIALNAWKRHHYTISGDVQEMEMRLVPVTISIS